MYFRVIVVMIFEALKRRQQRASAVVNYDYSSSSSDIDGEGDDIDDESECDDIHCRSHSATASASASALSIDTELEDSGKVGEKLSPKAQPTKCDSTGRKVHHLFEPEGEPQTLRSRCMDENENKRAASTEASCTNDLNDVLASFNLSDHDEKGEKQSAKKNQLGGVRLPTLKHRQSIRLGGSSYHNIHERSCYSVAGTGCTLTDENLMDEKESCSYTAGGAGADSYLRKMFGDNRDRDTGRLNATDYNAIAVEDSDDEEIGEVIPALLEFDHHKHDNILIHKVDYRGKR